LRLLFLPPYSPQLAPIERVWKLTRRLATHNRYFATLAEVLKAVSACFDRWRRAQQGSASTMLHYLRRCV
jgi:transposase